MAALYRASDAFVLATRGEGWGLPLLEAMACGLPVITTGIGPIREYATDQTALLLDYELVPARDSQDSTFDHAFRWGRWAEPDVLQLRRFMRWLYEHRGEGRELGRRAAQEARLGWTWRHAVAKALTALRAAGAE